MAATQIGKGHVVGIAGTEDIYGTAVIRNSVVETDDFEKKYTTDQDGNVVGGFAFNGKRTLKIDMIVAADTIAHAEAALKKPAKFATVTLSTFKDATLNGKWIYEGGATITYTSNDVAKISLPLVKFDADISAAVSA